MFKINTMLSALMVVGLIGVTDVSYAAFGGSRASTSSVGVSRSYSRPASAPVSRPAATPSSSSSSTTYSRPAYSQPTQSSQSYNSNPSYNNNQSSYNNNNGYQQPQRNSAMRDIGVTAAGVGGGILAASAIQSLISSPNHQGMYTSPQYPGQYFNAQGVPQSAPVDQGQQYQQPQVAYAPVQHPQYPSQQSGGFFSGLWSFLGGVIQLILWLAIVAAMAFGGYKAYRFFKGKYKEEMTNSIYNPTEEKVNLDNYAMTIFYDFQRNSDNKEWVAAHTKYLPVSECLSPASEVLRYEHQTIDCKVEQGKLRASVLYTADLKNSEGEESIHQYWNFEKDSGVWKLIGIEPV